MMNWTCKKEAEWLREIDRQIEIVELELSATEDRILSYPDEWQANRTKYHALSVKLEQLKRKREMKGIGEKISDYLLMK